MPEATAASKVAAALPKVAVATGLGLVNSIIATLPKIREFVVNTVKLLAPAVPGVSAALSVQIEKTVDSYLEMLSRFQPLTEASSPASGSGPSMVPDEIFLLIPVLRIRAKQGGLVESVLVEVIDRVDEALNPPAPPARPVLLETAAPVSGAAFDAELARLLARLPGLRDVPAVVAQCGAPPKALEILQGLATEENLLKARGSDSLFFSYLLCALCSCGRICWPSWTRGRGRSCRRRRGACRACPRWPRPSIRPSRGTRRPARCWGWCSCPGPSSWGSLPWVSAPSCRCGRRRRSCVASGGCETPRSWTQRPRPR